MNNRKMAIVSSYSESCGNAAFTRILHDSIEHYQEGVQVEVVELDLKLLQSIKRSVRAKANEHIQEICTRLKDYDLVNIQMEAGLYGTLPGDIVNRFRKLVSANPHTSVTLHSPRLISSAQSASRAGIKKLLKFDIKGGLRDLIGDKYAQIHLNINRKIVQAAIKFNARMIVHTNRSEKQVRDFFSYTNIVVHPLKMVPVGYVPNHDTLGDIARQANLAESDRLVGMFGYISAYKGHVDALNALEQLPDNYKLLIFGRQHPQTLKANGKPDEYLERLIGLIKNNSLLKKRVFFMGELNDNDFLDVVSSVDVAWLPYYENGQDGSGIASICLDLCPRVLCSTSFAFDELFKLVTYNNVMRFDIGNILEMGLKTEMILRSEKRSFPFCDDSTYSLKSQAETYVSGGVA
ncbi:glycosyltransferase [Pseudomonas sp. S2.OTC.A_B10]|uniref:glycosyltransferase n=1 Tax=Pseudomonas sp. S2.OTC.A_B10 TaxID=3237018 RepID=UPI003CF92C89